MSNVSVNKCDLSGSVLSIQDIAGGKGKNLTISQIAAGKFETHFSVIIAPPLSDALDISCGDEVLILNAICYTFENQIRFRISAENQLIITSKFLNQGTVEAKDMFI